MLSRISKVIALMWVCLCGQDAYSLEHSAERLDEIGIRPVLGQQIDLSLRFKTSDSQEITIGEALAGGKPVIVVPVYYHCPRLCGFLLSGVVELFKNLGLEMGRDYRVLTVSFNPVENVDDAEKAKTRYADMLGATPEQRSNWLFLLGDQQNITPLMSQIGFHYLPDGADFAHSAGLILLTPSGQVAQYFTGIEFPSFDVRLALVEASQGRIGSALDHVMLYCFRFDPTKGKYTWVMTGALRIAGAVTILFLGGLVGLLVFRERWGRKKKNSVASL